MKQKSERLRRYGVKRHLKLLILTCFLLACSLPSIAQGPTINTDTPILLGLEGKAVMLRSVLVHQSQLYRDGSKISDSLQRQVTATHFILAVPYNLTADFLVGMVIPVASINTKNIIERRSSFGLGDISLFAKYVLIQVDALQETFRIIGKGSVKLPTGNKNLNPPLGIGAVGYSLGGVSGWIGKRFGIYGELTYTLYGTANGLKHGDHLNYNAAFAFRAVPSVYEAYPAEQINLYLEFIGMTNSKDKRNGNELSDTGGDVIFLSPGIQYIPSRIFLLEASFHFPIVQSLNGTQLAAGYKALLGIRVLLY